MRVIDRRSRAAPKGHRETDAVSSVPVREGHLDIDGRRVGWTEHGDGEPIVFCNGAAMSSSFLFDAPGVRLICIDRAGLGRSSPDPNKSFASYARDVEAVLAHLGIHRPRVIGFSQGGPFAVALAGLASSLTLVAATDELAHPALRHLLVPDVARLIDAIAADAAGFEATFRADAEGLWQLILQMSSSHDRAIYEQPAFATAYRQALAEGFAQGPAGYVRDFVLASQRWPTPPEQIMIPVTLWYGALDTSPVHSPDFGATLAGRFPQVVRHLLADEGGSLLWTRARAIVAG